MDETQGFTKRDFRAALGLIRLAESSLTAVAYFILYRFFAVQLPTALRAETLGTRVGDALETRARLAPAVAARTID